MSDVALAPLASQQEDFIEKLRHVPLKKFVTISLENYFDHLDGQAPKDIYNLVTKEVEMGMLNVVMKKAKGNQSLAAQWLGLARGTLRKKLQQYNIE